MPDSIPTQPTQPTIPTKPTIPAIPTISPQQFQARRAADQAAMRALSQQQQKQLQQAATKPKPEIFRRIQNKTIAKGSLIVFNYMFFKHDPYPLVMVSELREGSMISGLNLHYFTFRYIRNLIQSYCGKAGFSYALFRNNKYIVNAYRSYKREGRRSIKILDCEFLLSILKGIRSFKPSEIEAMRKQIQEQLKAKLNPTAEDMSKQYQEMIYKQPYKAYGTGLETPDARFNPTDIEPIG